MMSQPQSPMMLLRMPRRPSRAGSSTPLLSPSSLQQNVLPASALTQDVESAIQRIVQDIVSRRDKVFYRLPSPATAAASPSSTASSPGEGELLSYDEPRPPVVWSATGGRESRRNPQRKPATAFERLPPPRLLPPPPSAHRLVYASPPAPASSSFSTSSSAAAAGGLSSMPHRQPPAHLSPSPSSLSVNQRQHPLHPFYASTSNAGLATGLKSFADYVKVSLPPGKQATGAEI